MGEGAVFFLLKRLADAERDGDRVYAVLRGIGGSSDGKGKGITAPNPKGQQLAIDRAWQPTPASPLDERRADRGSARHLHQAWATSSRSRASTRCSASTGSRRTRSRSGSVKSEHRPPEGSVPGAAGLLKTA